MSWELLVDTAGSLVELATNWWIQSAVLLAAGMSLGILCQRRGSAVQSAIYRMTLVAVIAAPVASWVLSHAGMTGWSIAMPDAWAAVPPESSLDEIETLPRANSPGSASAQAVDPLAARSIFPPQPLGAPDSSGIEGSDPYRTNESRVVSPTLTPALASPSSTVPAPSAQAPSDAAPVVLVSRFGIVAIVATGLWISAAVVQLARVAAAWRRLRRIRHLAVPAEDEAQEICRELSGRLGVAQPAVLRSPYLPSPCLAGLRRPEVLLPELPGDISVRDVLAHELAHLKRGDCHWNLLRQLAGAVLFFQPLLWLLSRRLEAAAEEVCDDYVLQLCGDRRGYAHRLVDIAELSLAPYAAAAVGMVSLRSMLGHRIARIMDSSRSLSTRVGNALMAAVLAGGILGTTVAGLVGLRAGAAPVDAPMIADVPTGAVGSARKSSDETQRSELSDDDVVTVRGRVVRPDGTPSPGAEVFVLRWYWNLGDRKPLASTVADAAGRFEISYRKSQFAETAGRANQWRETYVAGFAPGFGPGWAKYWDLKSGEDAEVKLAVDDVPIEGRVIDLEGNPVVGATIEVGSLAEPKAANLDEYIAAIRDGQAISTAYANIDESLPPHVGPHWPQIRTDAEGRFRLAGLGRERLINLHLSGPTIVTKDLRVATRPMAPIAHPAFAYENADQTTQYGAKFELAAAPSRPIEGVVRDAETGAPVAGAEIWSYKFAGEDISGSTSIKTKSDADGRYRLEGMPKGDGNRVVVVPTDLPYFTADLDVPNPPGSEPAPLDIELHRGVWVTGRVTDKVTGAPVAARLHYIACPDNELAKQLPEFENGRHAMLVQDRYNTDKEGRYRVAALPGHGIIGVNCVLTPYPGGQGYDAVKDLGNEESFRRFNGVFSPSEKHPTAMREIHADSAAPENVCDFALDPGRRLAIRTADSAGAPLTGVLVTGITELDGSEEQMNDAEFELTCFRAGEKRTVLLYHEDRKLGKALRVKIDEIASQPLTIALEPVGVISGRLVNDGEPVSGASLRFDVVGDNDWGRELRRAVTDADGRFRHEGVLPGLSYSILVEGAGIGFSIAAKEIEALPGETVDLGTIDLAMDERPEPMRSGGAPPMLEEQASTTPGAATPKNDAATDQPVDSNAQRGGQPDKANQLTGRVVGPDGKPIRDAKLYWISWSLRGPAPAPAIVATTDAEGLFAFDAPAAVKQTHSIELQATQQLAVRADGLGMAVVAPHRLRQQQPAAASLWQQIIGGAASAAASSQTIVLPDDAPIQGQIVDIDGQPVANARVSVREVSDSQADDRAARGAAAEPGELARWKNRLMAMQMQYAAPQLAQMAPWARTDAQGRFVLAGIGRDRLVELLIEGDRIESTNVFARTEPGEDFTVESDGNYLLEPVVIRGASFVQAVGPSKPLAGRVLDLDTGEPIAGATVRTYLVHGDPLSSSRERQHLATTSDAEGKYRITGLPVGEENGLVAFTTGDDPYVPAGHYVDTSAGGDEVVQDFRLKRGVWASGRVYDAETKEPLTGELTYSLFHDPKLEQAIPGLRRAFLDELYFTNANGEFRVPVLPARGILAFRYSGPKDSLTYPRGAGAESIDGAEGSGSVRMYPTLPFYLIAENYGKLVEVHPKEGQEQVAADMPLSAGITATVHAVSAPGEPLAGVEVFGANWHWRRSEEVDIRIIGLQRGQPRKVLLYHPPTGLVGAGTVDDQAASPVEIPLVASGSVRGRLVDEDGEPITDATIVSDYELSQTDARSGVWPPQPGLTSNPTNLPVDKDGRFQIVGLIPGWRYNARATARRSMSGQMVNQGIGNVFADVSVTSGQVLELGDVTPTQEPKVESKLPEKESTVSTAAGDASVAANEPASVPAGRPVHGKVTAANGKPAAGAHVAVIARITTTQRGGELGPYFSVLAEGKVNDDGGFELDIPADSPATHQDASVIARTADSAVAWKRLDLNATDAASPTLTLQNASPLVVRLVDIEGQSASGVQVRVESVMARSLLSLLSMQAGVGLRDCPTTPDAWIAPLVADRDGRLEIPGLAANYGVMLKVVGDDRFAPQDIALNTGLEEQRGERDGTYRPLVANNVGSDGATSLPLAPAQIFTGQVTFEDTKEPAPHARITIWASQQEYGSMTSVAGRADDQGLYRVSPNPGIRFGVTAYPPAGAPYLVRTIDQIKWKAGDRNREVDVRLPRGVLVRGEVVEKPSGQPVAGASVQYMPESANNPLDADDIVTGWQATQVTDDRGRFEIAVLPGPGRIVVHGPTNEYILHETSGQELNRGKPGGRRNYVAAIERIDPSPDSQPVEMKIAIERGATVRGELVDAAGAPVNQVSMVTRQTIRSFWMSWRGQPVDVLGNQFEVAGLASDAEVAVHFIEPRRQLGATAMLRAGMTPPRVVLQPCGKATMRFVDDDGQPVAEYEPNFQFVVTPGVHEFSKMARDEGNLAADADFLANVDRLNHGAYRKSDASGRYELSALIPGATYRLVGYRDGEFSVARDFVAESAKAVDLGDIVVQPQDR